MEKQELDNIRYSEKNSYSTLITFYLKGNGNEITNNKFENIAASAVFIESNRNRVEVVKIKDSSRNIGTSNLVIGTKNSKDKA